MPLEQSSETNMPGMALGNADERGNGGRGRRGGGLGNADGGRCHLARSRAKATSGGSRIRCIHSEVPLLAVATSACAALVRSRSSSACLRKSSMFFMLAGDPAA